MLCQVLRSKKNRDNKFYDSDHVCVCFFPFISCFYVSEISALSDYAILTSNKFLMPDLELILVGSCGL